jgi:lysophospholipase L1-like esterase
VLERLEEVTSSRPDKIFIMIGTNDLAYLKGVDHVLANYVKILDRIEQDSPSTRVYIQSILPTDDAVHTLRKNSDIRQLNESLEAIAGERGHTYIDLYTPFAGGEGKLNPDYSIDGLHVNGAGYLLWKDLIEIYVNE